MLITADTIAKITGPARTRRSLRSDKCPSASPGRRAKYRKIRPTVAVDRRVNAKKAKTTMGSAPRWRTSTTAAAAVRVHGCSRHPDNGCFPRVELLQAASELLGDSRA